MTDTQSSDRWSLQCPCCDATLTIDRTTGAILRTEPAKSTSAPESLGSALEALKAQEQARRERVLQRAEEEKHRKEILAKKVEEARKQAKETEGPPPRPFDFE
ncbi:MAG: hypothetical protein ACE5H5_01660 [Nitrospinota bacterium]